jgi:RimJ/RimL family protein N-acetyltransferase
MLNGARDPVFTPRLELRRTRLKDAAAMFEALRDPAIYAYIPRSPPTEVADVEQRFARIMQETAPGRAGQWLNWTVWLRENSTPIGMTEATVQPDGAVSIGYMFDPRCWRRGFGREAVAAMLGLLATHGATAFEATIDIRNEASRALAASRGFKLAATIGIDETWRRNAQSG